MWHRHEGIYSLGRCARFVTVEAFTSWERDARAGRLPTGPGVFVCVTAMRAAGTAPSWAGGSG